MRNVSSLDRVGKGGLPRREMVWLNCRSVGAFRGAMRLSEAPTHTEAGFGGPASVVVRLGLLFERPHDGTRARVW